MSISGTILAKTIGITAGLGVGGLGAYNFMTTGCVTGMGCSTEQAGTATLVAQETPAPPCHMSETTTVAASAEASACTDGMACTEGEVIAAESEAAAMIAAVDLDAAATETSTAAGADDCCGSCDDACCGACEEVADEVIATTGGDN